MPELRGKEPAVTDFKLREELLAKTLPKEQDLVRPRGEGRKDDREKPRFDLLPWGPITEVVKVLTLGAVTYADDNWKQVPRARQRYFSAAQRHLTAWWEGELNDPQTKLSHLAHAVCCLLFLLWFDLNALIVKLPEDGWCEATHHRPGGEVQEAHPKSSGCVNWGPIGCDAVHHRPGPDGACR